MASGYAGRVRSYRIASVPNDSAIRRPGAIGSRNVSTEGKVAIPHFSGRLPT